MKYVCFLSCKPWLDNALSMEGAEEAYLEGN